MKKFCESLREHKLKILDFENTKMVPLTNKQQDDMYEKINICCIYKLFVHKYTNDKTIAKLGTIAIIQVNTEVLHIAYTI